MQPPCRDDDAFLLMAFQAFCIWLQQGFAGDWAEEVAFSADRDAPACSQMPRAQGSSDSQGPDQVLCCAGLCRVEVNNDRV